MKILHVFDFFSPLGGGLVDVVYKLSRTQSQRGHDVTIYAGDYKLDSAYIASLANVKVVTFHCISTLAGFFIMPGILKEARDNLKSFDIIHIHAARSFQSIIIRHYAKKYGVPYIINAHGTLVRGVPGKRGIKRLLKWIFDVFFGYRISREASMVVTENEFGAREYEDYGVSRDKIAFIPLFFPLEDFAQLPAPGNFRNRHSIQEKYIIMSLGRIHWIKGLDFLVDSYCELRKLRKDVILVIVGSDDGYLARLKRQIKKLRLSDKVYFPGFLSGQDKLSALVDADVVVQPSRYEQALWAPIEAVLCGTPIIVTKNTGAREDVEKMGAGYLVDFGDKKQLVSTLQSILDEPLEAQAKVQAGREYINANLTLNKKVEEYEKLYQECMGKTHRKGA